MIEASSQPWTKGNQIWIRSQTFIPHISRCCLHLQHRSKENHTIVQLAVLHPMNWLGSDKLMTPIPGFTQDVGRCKWPNTCCEVETFETSIPKKLSSSDFDNLNFWSPFINLHDFGLCWRTCCAPYRCYKHQAHCCITTAARANRLHMSFLFTEFEHFTIGNNGQRSVPARLEVVHEDRLWCFLSQFWCCKLYCIHQLIRSQDVDDSEMLGFAGPWRWTNIVRPVHLFIVFDKPTQPILKKNA